MEPVCISIPEAMRALGIGRTKIYELINGHKLLAVKIGRRTLVTTASIRRFAGQAPANLGPKAEVHI